MHAVKEVFIVLSVLLLLSLCVFDVTLNALCIALIHNISSHFLWPLANVLW